MNRHDGAPPSPHSLTFPSDISRSPSPDPPHSPALSDIGLSPSASTFLRTAATLEGLAQQLSSLSNEDDGLGGGECCCGASEEGGGCKMARRRERIAEKLVLSGEIGNALLQRYEALEKKHAFEVKRLQQQVEVKRTSLGDSVRRINALEKVNGTHLSKYSDLNRKYEALEKRYTQSLHTQNLTQQSLTHVRTELTTLRNTMQRQSIALASGAGVEERLSDAERRYEEARELQIAAERQVKEEARKRTRAEARIGELEQQLRVARREVEDIKDARTKDAGILLDNAKTRLETLHQELSMTFHADSPAEQSEYLRALEGLVASNAMLKHDVSQLSHLLAESKDDVRGLRDENDELRAINGAAGRVSPGVPPHLAAELRQSHSHSRTESSPITGTFDRSAWARMSVSSSTRWEHNRRSSFAPSFASTSTADGGLTSPGLGMGSIGEFGGQLMREQEGALSPLSDGRESPQLGGAFRSSPSGGIGYVLNGVPKMGAVKPQYRRRASDRPRMPSRSYTSQGVGSIAESAPLESDVGHTTDEPLSPASEYFRAADINRKRRSLMLHRHHSASPHESADYSSATSRTLVDASTADGVSAHSEGEIGSSLPAKPSPAKAAHRRTLLLLTKSKGTQTDPYDPVEDIHRFATTSRMDPPPPAIPPSVTSTGTSPQPEEHSETSSLHPPVSGPLTTLVEHLSKLLGRLRAADIPTLNRRLKKQHLSADVSHLSRSTLRALHTEITDTKNLFRGLLDSTSIQRKEWNMLFKLMKDVFTELVDMQAVINDVTLEPKLAKRLQKEAFRDEEEEAAAAAAAAAGGGVGLGWIANPITRLFVTPAAEVPVDTKRAGDRGKLQAGGPQVKAASKQAAVSGATTTHVSVEFAGAGMTRRATPAPVAISSVGSGVTDALPTSPNPMSGTLDRSRQVSTNSVATIESTKSDSSMVGTTRTLRPPGSGPGPGTLRPSKSRANRNELLGIFAGAQAPRPPLPLPGGQPWVVLDSAISPTEGAGPRLRGASSQYFGPGAERTIRARDGTTQRKRLSAVVDAVIDNPGEDEGVTPTHELPYQQQLFTRTMRPRGLSDSSIRSTYVSHAATSEMMPTAPPVDSGSSTARQGGYAGGLLAGLGRRMYWGKAEVSPVNPIDAPPPPPPPPIAQRSVSTSSREIKESTIRSSSASSTKPISVSPSPNKRGISAGSTATTTTHQGSNTGAGGGFLSFLEGVVGSGAVQQGMNDSDEDALAGSVRRREGAGMDKLERAEMSVASFRQGVYMGGGSVR